MTAVRRSLPAAIALLAAITACSAPPGSQPAPASPAPSGPAKGSASSAPATAPAPQGPLEIARDLDVPWGVAFLPDGSGLVTLRNEGRVVRIAPGRQVDVGTIPGVEAEGEGGLLGIAVSPTFAQDRLVFAYHTTATDNRVVRLRLEGDRLVPDRVIVEAIPRAGIHNGGRIAFGPDGFLYVATGDANQRGAAQDRESLGGKILRLTADGAPAPGNPFGNRVYSLGHRNVQGLAWRGSTLYATEFGQNTWDELNEIKPGANYGWPTVEGRGNDPAYENPVVQWTTDEASPSGLAIVGDTAYVAALRGERVWRVDLTNAATRAMVEGHGRIRHVAAAPDGRLWVVTSNTFRGDRRSGDDRILSVPAE